MKRYYLPVGTKFRFKSDKTKRYIIVEINGMCNSCAFEGLRCDTLELPFCSRKVRFDQKSVIFKEIKDDTSVIFKEIT